VHCNAIDFKTPSTAMESGLVSTTTFVVNLRLLKDGMQLHEGLSMDDFPVNTSSNTKAFFDAVQRRDLRDLPYYLPVTSTATERLKEHTQLRLSHRVYIIDGADMPSQFKLPYVIHWNYSEGVALRALVVTNAIVELPLSHLSRVSLLAQNRAF
jgi:hypothetical protein